MRVNVAARNAATMRGVKMAQCARSCARSRTWSGAAPFTGGSSAGGLDAKYEARAAYILSQKHEGWTQTAERYDDSGFSGGSMQSPGLQRLLAEVEAGRVGEPEGRIMRSIPIENGEVSLVRSMVPLSTEIYFVFKNGGALSQRAHRRRRSARQDREGGTSPLSGSPGQSS